jgi:hypothetical protein
VRNIILSLQAAQAAGESGAAEAKRAVDALARAMGIVPSSEKVDKAKSKAAEIPVDQELAKLVDDERKLKLLARFVGQRLSTTRKLMAEVMNRPQPDPDERGSKDEGPSRELVLAGGTPTGHQENHESQASKEQEELMGPNVLETDTDTLRRDFCISRKNWNLRGKKLFDPKTGRTCSPDHSDIGPPNWNVTWRAMINVIMLVFGMAVPGSRVEKMLGKDGFSRTNISDMCAYVAMRLLPVYVALCEQVAQADIIMGDDCVSRVNDVSRCLRRLKEWKRARKAANDTTAFDESHPKPESPWRKLPEASLSKKLEEELDFEFQHTRTNAKKTPKIRLHTSLLSAETVAGDPKSRVVVYRTHLGSTGNLLGRILRSRKSRRPLTFVGDLSPSNHVTDPDVLKHVSITYAGCASHARRPFKRQQDLDPENCIDALDYFRALFQIEDLIDDRRTRDRAEIREQHSLHFWNELRDLCQTMRQKWSPATALGEGVEYLLENFESLTLYCRDSRLPLSNDLSERLLRYEKLMDRSSFGRESIEGRARYDIIRSFWQSCVAAGVDPTFALLEVLHSQPAAVESNPSSFTPHAIAARLKENEKRAMLLDRILTTSSLGDLVKYKIHDPNLPDPATPA